MTARGVGFRRRRRTAWAVGACVAVMAVEVWRFASTPEGLLTAAFAVEAPASPPRLELVEEHATVLPMAEPVGAAHASAVVALPGERLLAFWWAGSRESGPDVRVFMSRWEQGQWTLARAVLDRDTLGAQLGFGVRRIGNPTAWTAPDGAVHLYVVATGLGGWAASRVVHLVSRDDGERFDLQRVLPLSPLWNTSALVRSAPVGLEDGGWLLPAYFELGRKYPMLVAFDQAGELRWVSRMGRHSQSLQPAFAPLDRTELRAWMRDHGGEKRLRHAVSRDAGRTWQDLPSLPIENDDTSVAVLRLQGGGYVMVHNERTHAQGSARARLRLSVSDDAIEWRPGPDVVRGAHDEEHSYPSLVQLGEKLHVLYSRHRRAIGHHVFHLGDLTTRRVR